MPIRAIVRNLIVLIVAHGIFEQRRAAHAGLTSLVLSLSKGSPQVLQDERLAACCVPGRLCSLRAVSRGRIESNGGEAARTRIVGGVAAKA